MTIYINLWHAHDVLRSAQRNEHGWTWKSPVAAAEAWHPFSQWSFVASWHSTAATPHCTCHIDPHRMSLNVAIIYAIYAMQSNFLTWKNTLRAQRQRVFKELLGHQGSTKIQPQRQTKSILHAFRKYIQLVGGLVAIFYFPRNIGFLIIPIDEIIFFRGVAQPPTSQHLPKFNPKNSRVKWSKFWV